ncbi:MFS general substrate transporter [Mollisia scopiformis]|uniref:MFS general substrate transporter n=1 Tax=Mollisia scopiformis TaxID=149040 RepID=A0A194X015_MOLSC|nr:MFS general substrate transporter [Mollisia scopiformis]KUJ13212.1 MFS general substrate transporter [Mollisia scopiformis]
MTVIQESSPKVDETSPLLATEPSKPKKWGKSVVYCTLLCGFLVTLSFSVTQVPMIYVFRLMTCDAYYETHPEPGPGFDRCSNHEIEAGTARAVSLVGASTTFFGVINLFVTGWSIKRFGIKTSLAIQVFWPAVRLAVQNVGVDTGSGTGILIIQLSQIITIIGGPAGYLLSLNSYITEIVSHEERTGVLGQLQGCAMFGNALGYLAGGLLADWMNIAAPFRVTLMLFILSCIYVLLVLPSIPKSENVPGPASKGITKFFGPLKTFAPQKWVLIDGRTQREYGAGLLGIGVFLGVLATGYIPVLLQMYATDIFGFGTTANGYLVATNSLIRGLFLTLAFPRIITAGRKWLESKKETSDTELNPSKPPTQPEPTMEPTQIDEVEAMENEEEAVEPLATDEKETFQFDLFFTRWSLIADGVLTGAASFVTEGWQMYLIAVMLPLASGTGSSAKGTILQMCPASERADALSAITLVDMVARLTTTTVFGLIFAAFADIGQTYLVFTCNAAVALLGFIVLLFSRFPPDGSKRFVEETREPLLVENETE